jgi:hypothetical protein
VAVERHHPVSLPAFAAVILPFESDALVIECDEPAVRDRDGVSIRDHHVGYIDWATYEEVLIRRSSVNRGSQTLTVDSGDPRGRGPTECFAY